MKNSILVKKCVATVGAVGALLAIEPRISAANLIVNGDFSNGNTGFTNGYVFSTFNSGGGGEYTITPNPASWNAGFQSPPAWFDHSPSTNNLALLINGSPSSGLDCWRQTIPVTSNTVYSVSGWASDLFPATGGAQARLQFFVNGTPIGSPFTVQDQTGVPIWGQFSATFASGASSSVVLSIRDLDTTWEANDVALDDLIMESTTNAPPPPPVCTTTPAGAVSWWRAEANGNDAVDGNPATILNGLGFATGQVGQAFLFTNSGAHARVAASASLNVGVSNGFTIEAWINPTDVASGRPLIEWNNGSSVGAHFWLCLGSATPGLFGANLVDSSGGSHVITTSGGVIAANTFQHVALTYDKPSGIARLFRNGTVVAQASLGNFTPQTTYNMLIGHRVPGGLGTGTFAGLMDEVTLYNRALTTNEIVGLFTASTAGKCVTVVSNPPPATNCVSVPGALSWWRAQSNTLDSLDGNHGTLVGNATYGPGRSGPGFVLDGDRDGVLVGSAPNLQLQNFSIEGWIKRTSPTTISFNGNGGAEIFALGAGGGGFGFYLRPDARLALGKLQVNEATSSASIADTNWHHVAVTKTNTVVVFYVDGVAYPAPAYNSGGFTYTGPGYIGAWLNPDGLVDNSFFGTIDELAFYGRALTPAEIAIIYGANSAGKCPPPNRPPQANPQSVTLPEDSSRAITLTGADPDGDPLTFTIVTGPTNGTLSGSAPNLVYTPATNYFGPDSFRFRVNDGQTSSPPATVSITVQPGNDVPVAQAQSVATDEDTPLAITLGAFDADGDSLTYGLTAPSFGSLTGTPPNLTYTPNPNYHGPDSFTFNVSDGQTNSNTATISITVRSVNDAPVAQIVVSPLTQLLGITNNVVLAAVCGDGTVILDGSQSSDVDGDALTYEWAEGTNFLGAAVIITNEFAIGTHEITLTVNDGHLNGVATTTVEVVSPAQGIGIMIAYIEDSDLGRRNGRPLVASLKAAAASFDDCRTIPGVNQMEAFQNKVRAQIAPLDADLAAKLIEAAQQVIDVVQAGH